MSTFAVPIKAQPWLERSGRLSWLKLVVFAGLFLPGLFLLARLWLDQLGPKPVTELIHGTGQWSVRFLLLSLAVTPLRRVGEFRKLILVRRMLGIAALVYILVHFTLYIVSENFNLVTVVSEIVLRIYLTIGFVALVGLCVLGATSTDAAIRRLGAHRWNRLHQLVYAITILALLHFLMQTKLNVTEPILMTGFFVLLMGHRLLQRFKRGDNVAALIGLAVVSGLLTALIEAGWYGVATRVPPMRVLQANLVFNGTLRPAWWVLIVGLGLVALRLARPFWARKEPARPVRAARAAS